MSFYNPQQTHDPKVTTEVEKLVFILGDLNTNLKQSNIETAQYNKKITNLTWAQVAFTALSAGEIVYRILIHFF